MSRGFFGSSFGSINHQLGVFANFQKMFLPQFQEAPLLMPY